MKNNVTDERVNSTEIVASIPKDISLETRKLVNAIAGMRRLEETLPDLQTIEEVENLRAHCMALNIFATEKQKSALEEWISLGRELEQWAIRVSMLCQRRVGQLWKEMPRNKGGRPLEKKTGYRRDPVIPNEPSPPTLIDHGINKRYAHEARTLAQVPEEALKAKLDEAQASEAGIRKQKLIAEVKRDAKARGEIIDDKTVNNRARMRERDRDRQTKINQSRPPAPKLSPKEKFNRYWTQEHKLLARFFEVSELEKIGELWWQEFQAFRHQEEETLLQARQAAERRKALAELAKDGQKGENKLCQKT